MINTGKPFILFISLFLISCSLKVARVSELVQKKARSFLFEELISYNNSVVTLEGKAFVMYKESEKTFSFRVEVAADKNEMNFRLDIGDFVFKIPLITVIQEGEDVLVINYSKKTFSRLQYKDLDFKNMTGLNIPKDILVNSVLGEVFIIKGDIEVSESDNLLLSINGMTEKENVLFNEKLMPIEALYILHSDSLLVNFYKFNGIEKEQFPYKITIKNEDKLLQINYSSLTINSPINSDLFSFDTSNLKGFTRLN